jgi:ABC-2 type transport system permease protein
MTRLVTAEIFKLRTTRTFYGVVGGALGLVLLIVIIASATATWNPGNTPMRDLLGISGFAQVFALVLGILAVTSEFRFGTITPSLLVVPDRVRLTLAKLGASLATGLALGAVATGLTAAIGAAILNARGIDTGLSGSQVTKMIVGGIVATALYAALGVGVGAIVRNQVGAVVGTLVYLFVLENLLQIIKGLRDPLAKYGFGGVGQGLTGTGDAGADHPPLGQVSAGLVLAGYCAIFLLAGIAMMRRRDVTA